jgi:hypothetical protein
MAGPVRQCACQGAHADLGGGKGHCGRAKEMAAVDYSESRLIVILAALGNNVSIVVEPTKGHGHITVRERAAA